MMDVDTNNTVAEQAAAEQAKAVADAAHAKALEEAIRLHMDTSEDLIQLKKDQVGPASHKSYQSSGVRFLYWMLHKKSPTCTEDFVTFVGNVKKQKKKESIAKIHKRVY
uniref:Uncharacterized protein n=1 Tax=Fibrocapsa japonica TaxID=94617 RepID=A0A7S2UTL1_9STRA|mmetsp:Transcript_12755/g.18815  ORF Transcript_12755/g.18815 Transcript_12755/m.18815 type:complete len:109 (+) Transcript_12755:38-364(+)